MIRNRPYAFVAIAGLMLALSGAAGLDVRAPATRPADVRWCVVGIEGADPRGVVVPLNDDLRAAIVRSLTTVVPPPTTGPVEPPPVEPPTKRRIGTAGFAFNVDTAGWPVYPVRGDANVVRVDKAADLPSAMRRLEAGRQNVIELAGGVDFGALPLLSADGRKIISGQSPGFPLIVRTVPGSAARARIRTSATGTYQPDNEWVVLSDLEFDGGNRNPKAGGVRFFNSRGLFLDGCLITGYGFGITREGAGSDLSVWRCVVADNFGDGGMSSGIYADRCKGIFLGETIWDANGWDAKDGHPDSTIHNHDAYIAGDNDGLVAWGNVFARASSHGLQSRPGGTVEANLFYNDPIGLSYGLANGAGPLYAGGVQGAIRSNVFEGGGKIAGAPRGWAVEVANVRGPLDASGNVFINSTAGRGAFVVLRSMTVDHKPRGDAGVKGMTIRGAVTSNWPDLIENQIGADVLLADNDDARKRPTLSDYAKACGCRDAAEWLARARENRRGHWDQRFTGSSASAWLKAAA